MKETKYIGKQSIVFSKPPFIVGAASVAGKKESEGPLGAFFDEVDRTDKFGGETWEEAESLMMKKAVTLCAQNAGADINNIRTIIAGDLLGQLIATSFGVEDMKSSLLGVYGACSTMGEAMLISAMMTDGGYTDRAIAVTSSHFASAERQFRFPSSYGNQRPLASTWTVTGSGAVLIGQAPSAGSHVCIHGGTIGRINDYGAKLAAISGS